MRFLLAGPDDYSLKAKLRTIKDSLGDPDMLSTATSIFEGSRLKPDDFRMAVNSVPFLSPARLVIVNGLLNRFQPKQTVSSPKKKPQSENPEEFAEIIRSSPGSTAIVLTETSLNRTNHLFKAISEVVDVFEFPVMDKPRLKNWIGQRVLNAGGQITPGAINLLVQYIGADLWVAASEIDKLVLYSAGRMITEKEVKELASFAREVSIFTLVDAIFEQKLKLASEALESLKSGGLSASYVLSMIARQLRLVIQIKDLKCRGYKDSEIRRELGVSSDFVWRKAQDHAARFPIAGFKDIFVRLLEADISLKTGNLDETTAIELLVAELTTA